MNNSADLNLSNFHKEVEAVFAKYNVTLKEMSVVVIESCPDTYIPGSPGQIEFKFLGQSSR